MAPLKLFGEDADFWLFWGGVCVLIGLLIGCIIEPLIF